MFSIAIKVKCLKGKFTAKRTKRKGEI